MSIIHNNSSSTGLNQERNLHRSSTVYKPKESKTALNKYVGGFWCKIQLEEMDFFTGGSIIMDYITGILVKSILIMDLFFTNIVKMFWLHKMLIDGLEWCGLLVDYCDVFISCLDSHSDGTHSLQRIHQWASDGMLHFSKSDEETNSSTFWMAWKYGRFQIFWGGELLP